MHCSEKAPKLHEANTARCSVHGAKTERSLHGAKTNRSLAYQCPLCVGQHVVFLYIVFIICVALHCPSLLYILSYRFSCFELHTSVLHFYTLFCLLASYNCHALHCSASLLWKDALTQRCQHGAIQPARCGNRTKPTRHENQAQPTRLWI